MDEMQCQLLWIPTQVCGSLENNCKVNTFHLEGMEIEP